MTIVKFTETTPGWPNSGFDKRTTEIEARRVRAADRDEAQISITIWVTKGKRVHQQHGSICLSPASVQQLIEALK
ncbi:MAG: hypothetical protein KIT32_12015 [Rhodocyclaceae bacterium]|nr:hypothetical protein [Rhodocyclaceae bacterium]